MKEICFGIRAGRAAADGAVSATAVMRARVLAAGTGLRQGGSARRQVQWPVPSHIVPPLDAHAVPLAANASAGQVSEPPVHVSSTSQSVAAPRQTVVGASK